MLPLLFLSNQPSFMTIVVINRSINPSLPGLLLHSIASLGIGGTSPLIFDDAAGHRSGDFAGLTAKLAQAGARLEPGKFPAKMGNSWDIYGENPFEVAFKI